MIARALRALAPAKVNLYLKVIGRRPDGFHELVTLFEAIDAHDVLTFREAPSGIRLTTNRFSLPTGPKNLVYRAAEMIRACCGVRTGVRIHLEKKLPVASGLGGGSSDAATTLLALNRLWKLDLPLKKLLELAGRFGSDIPFFVLQKSYAVGQGRGEVLKALNVQTRLWHVLVTPRLHVLAKDVYGRLDAPRLAPGARGRAQVRVQAEGAARLAAAVSTGGLSAWKSSLFNSLEATVLAIHPSLRKVQSDLLLAGADAAMLSGSGPTVFGLAGSKKQAHAIAAKIRRRHPSKFLAVTCTADPASLI